MQAKMAQIEQIKPLKTRFRRTQEAKEDKVFNMYNELMSVPGAMTTQVEEIIMQKMKIASRSTIWSIRKRAEKRHQNGQTK